MAKLKKINRRHFLKSASAGIPAFTIVSGYVMGRNGQTPPSGKLNIGQSVLSPELVSAKINNV